MMFFNEMLKLLLTLLRIIGNVLLWFFLAIAFFMGLSSLNTEYYQPNDTPNPQFRVGVINENKQTYGIELSKLGNETLATTPSTENCMDDCLLQKEENFIYHNDSPMKSTDSEYQIVNGKVVPISFEYFTIFEGLEAFVLAFVGFAMVKYAGLRIWYQWYQRSPEKVRELNQVYLQGLKICLVFLGVIAIFCMMMFLLNR